MNWRQKIAIVVLMVLAALPLAGTVCAMACLPDSTADAGHHEDGQDCERSTPASSDASPAASAAAASAAAESAADRSAADRSGAVRIGVLAEHDCRNHSGSLPHVAATAPQRADLAVMSAQIASDPVDPLFGHVTASESLFQYAPPPGTAPPTATPLVLRI